MVSPERAAAQAAPGRLERIRELLNTWSIPNDTRQPTDRFAEYAARCALARAEHATVRSLRDDLRAAVEGVPDADERLNGWLGRAALAVTVQHGKVTFESATGPVGDLLVAVLDAMNAGHWQRLKACPDCHWVFYDHTRNGSKRWCLMNAGGPDGRACGTIAKVRRHRQRRARSPLPAAAD